MIYSKDGSYPSNLPNRIRLSNGLTRTDSSTFTEDEIADAGYVLVPDVPSVATNQKILWDPVNLNWNIEDKTQEEIDEEINNQWKIVRLERDKKINETSWRYERYFRHERLGIPQIDSLQNLDAYIQALADIPETQMDPFVIVWPTLEETEQNAN